MSAKNKTHQEPEAWPLDTWGTVEIPYRTRCKHGYGDCARCGTSDRRDALHTIRAYGHDLADRYREVGAAKARSRATTPAYRRGWDEAFGRD